MWYKIEEIVASVRVALDENQPTGEALVDDVDALARDEIVTSKIEEAVRMVEGVAPLSMISVTREDRRGVISWDGGEEGQGAGSIALPEDYFRLLYFKMSDWDRGVNRALEEDDEEYAHQRSRFPGVRGCPQRPKVAVVWRGGGEGRLEFYSSSRGVGVGVERFVYRPKVEIKDGGVEISEKLYTNVVYRCASLVALTYGDKETAGVLSEMGNVYA